MFCKAKRVSLRKTKGGLSNDESLFKLVYLAYKDIAKNGINLYQIGLKLYPNFQSHLKKD